MKASKRFMRFQQFWMSPLFLGLLIGVGYKTTKIFLSSQTSLDYQHHSTKRNIPLLESKQKLPGLENEVPDPDNKRYTQQRNKSSSISGSNKRIEESTNSNEQTKEHLLPNTPSNNRENLLKPSNQTQSLKQKELKKKKKKKKKKQERNSVQISEQEAFFKTFDIEDLFNSLPNK